MRASPPKRRSKALLPTRKGARRRQGGPQSTMGVPDGKSKPNAACDTASFKFSRLALVEPVSHVIPSGDVLEPMPAFADICPSEGTNGTTDCIGLCSSISPLSFSLLDNVCVINKFCKVFLRVAPRRICYQTEADPVLLVVSAQPRAPVVRLCNSRAHWNIHA